MQNMHGLIMFCLLIMFLMIYGVGWLAWRIWRRQDAAALERAAIRNCAENARTIAKAAASEAAACAAVIDKLEKPQPKRRHMHAVRDEKAGVSTWEWR